MNELDIPMPENVRVELPDGTIIPVELTYEGFHNDTHVWVAVPTTPVVPVGSRFLCDTLPGRTSVSFLLRDPNLPCDVDAVFHADPPERAQIRQAALDALAMMDEPESWYRRPRPLALIGIALALVSIILVIVAAALS